ncbi:chromosome partitioning protein ParA [Spiroplasma sp. TIUS-1]|uniref:ParA family protein n=1 Tax=Spiroplasma sp. TIUS-1 TaxID=216963 RepID=UPI001398806E|nr:AAA family ATPase [Spiroplasma sp. TIUS-1]QHX36221.1 chromosome partitioning protein ParA [Spiroplasma sp. TIUS-1]
MGKIIAITNQKGGVGKTTTSINLACGLAIEGKKVLLMDVDSQYNASSGVGFRVSNSTKSIFHMFTENLKYIDVIQKEVKENLDLIASTSNISSLDFVLGEKKEQYVNVLKNDIKQLKDIYDFIIIDCPPSLGIINICVLEISDSIIIPIQAEHYALHGVAQLLKTVKAIKASKNQKLQIEGVLVTMYDSRTKLCRDVYGEIKKTFGDKTYSALIPRSIKIAEAPMMGESIYEYDKSNKAAKSYAEFTREVLKNNG